MGKRSVDPEMACQTMRAGGVEPSTPFPGVDVRWPGVCMTCGREVAPTLSNIRQGQGGCRPCGRRRAGAKNRGSANPCWTGSDASYMAVHKRLLRLRGPAHHHTCVDCGAVAGEWSYDGRSSEERVSEGCHHAGLRYSSDISDYSARCISCHRAYDRKAMVS